MDEFTKKYPCEMVVAIAYHSTGKWSGEPYGCVTEYKGELSPGIKEALDDYAPYIGDIFHDGAELPKQSGIYKFIGNAEVCMIGGSDEPIVFNGEFKKQD